MVVSSSSGEDGVFCRYERAFSMGMSRPTGRSQFL